jgi:hypothetical protein
MPFMQTISFTTSRIDEIAAIGHEYERDLETDAFARRLSELVDGPPTYGNYDVLDG